MRKEQAEECTEAVCVLRPVEAAHPVFVSVARPVVFLIVTVRRALTSPWTQMRRKEITDMPVTLDLSCFSTPNIIIIKLTVIHSLHWNRFFFNYCSEYWLLLMVFGFFNLLLIFKLLQPLIFNLLISHNGEFQRLMVKNWAPYRFIFKFEY